MDSVLAGVQERDKWRRRVELLERALGEVRDRRRRLEARLRRLRKEVQKLRRAAEEFVEGGRHTPSIEVGGAPRGQIFR